MNYVTENITPAKAKIYLSTSAGNRPLSKVFVQSYAETMKSGKWLLNGMCIIFDNEGRLVDGHHRLQAVIEANIPVRFDVIRGVAPQSFTTYDCGRHRTVGQLLAMQDVKHYNLVASIVVTNERILKAGRLHENNSSAKVDSKKMSNADKIEIYRRDPDGYNSAANVVVSLLTKCRIINGSWAGGLYYYLTHTGGYSQEKVLQFLDALFSLDTSGIVVCDMLRKVILKEKIAGKKMKAELLWALIVKTWNHYVDGTTPKILRYIQTIEELPKLKLNNYGSK